MMDTRRTQSTLAILMLVLASQAVFAENYITYESMIWDRHKDAPGRALFTDPAIPTNTGTNLSFQGEGNHRIILGWELENFDFEGGYTRAGAWTANHVTTRTTAWNFETGAVPGLNFVTALSQAADADANADGLDTAPGITPNVFVNYDSEFEQAEANIRRMNPYFSSVRDGFGFSFMNVEELMTIDVRGNFNDPAAGLSHANLIGGAALFTNISGGGNGFTDPAAGAESALLLEFDANVQNNMYGFQYMADFLLYESDYCFFDAMVKTGVYYNRIRGSVTERLTETNLDMDVYQRVHTNASDQVAWTGNVKLRGGVKLRENIRAFVGYEVLYITGVAVASDQYESMQVTGGQVVYTVNVDQILAHGGNIGLEIFY